jgi:outer membrane immunogenic protein
MRLRTSLMAGALIFPGVALAADLPGSGLSAALLGIPSFTWTGFYVGLQAGYGWGTTRASYTAAWRDPTTNPFAGVEAASASLSPIGFAGGGYAGFNYQLGPVVAGIEGDISFASVKGTTLAVVESSLGTLGSVRGRLGLPLAEWLVYVTGGVAFGDPKLKDALGYNIEWKGNTTGWVAGIGVEYAFMPNLIGRMEYLYTDFGGKTRVYTQRAGTLTVNETENGSFSYSVTRAGLAYKF